MPLLLCDLDNTLVDRDAAFRRWAELIAARFGRHDDFVAWLVEADDQGYGSRRELWEGFRSRLGVGDADYAATDYYRDFLPQFRTDDDVCTALADARTAGWRIAIVTNGPATQHDKIHHAGLESLVDTWCVSDVEGHAKPDARLLEIAADRAGRHARRRMDDRRQPRHGHRRRRRRRRRQRVAPARPRVATRGLRPDARSRFVPGGRHHGVATRECVAMPDTSPRGSGVPGGHGVAGNVRFNAG